MSLELTWKHIQPTLTLFVANANVNARVHVLVSVSARKTAAVNAIAAIKEF